MGTRGAIGFRVDGQDKVTYQQFDSYPTGVGVNTMKAIQAFTDEQINAAARRIELVDQDSAPTTEQIARYAGFTNLGVGGQSVDDWYCLLRDAQGNLIPYIDGSIDHMIDSHTFLADSLFCEWAYILDVGRSILEVYQGFNSDPTAPGRYAAIQQEGFNKERDYFGVVLIREIPFDEVRSVDAMEYMQALQDEVEDEDED